MPGEPEFQCRVCRSREYVAVGRSRLGARFYACAGCSGVFMDPARWSRPVHEQVTPGLDHLQPAPRRSAGRGQGQGQGPSRDQGPATRYRRRTGLGR